MPLTEIDLKTKQISLYSIQNILNTVHILDSGGNKTCQGLHKTIKKGHCTRNWLQMGGRGQCVNGHLQLTKEEKEYFKNPVTYSQSERGTWASFRDQFCSLHCSPWKSIRYLISTNVLEYQAPLWYSLKVKRSLKSLFPLSTSPEITKMSVNCVETLYQLRSYRTLYKITQYSI